MAEQALRTFTDDESAAGANSGAVSWRQRLVTWFTQRLSRRLLAVLLAASLVMNAAVFVYVRSCGIATVARPSSPEFELGAFEFRGSETAGTVVEGAKFSLCISLLDGVESAAREHLTARRHGIQQAVEELLRTAHSDDFEDPSLRGLKRQVQEQINGVLGMRAISEVIITNLVLKRGRQPADGKTQTAGSVSLPLAPSG
jgi:hypothetical protein